MVLSDLLSVPDTGGATKKTETQHLPFTTLCPLPRQSFKRKGYRDGGGGGYNSVQGVSTPIRADLSPWQMRNNGADELFRGLRKG